MRPLSNQYSIQLVVIYVQKHGRLSLKIIITLHYDIEQVRELHLKLLYSARCRTNVDLHQSQCVCILHKTSSFHKIYGYIKLAEWMRTCLSECKRVRHLSVVSAYHEALSILEMQLQYLPVSCSFSCPKTISGHLFHPSVCASHNVQAKHNHDP